MNTFRTARGRRYENDSSGVISVQQIQLDYGSTRALDDVSLSISPGENVAIVGPSGSGKSSLLYCLAGLELPTAGEVRHGDITINHLDLAGRTAWRLRHAGFVFQSADLVPELTLWDNISLPLELLGERRATVTQRVGALVEELALAECSRRRPHQVSGGQAQRAAVARAVAHQPSVIFADEPTGALDSQNRVNVLELLQEQTRRLGSTLIMVTHDESATWAGLRTIRMSDGHVIADSAGEPRSVGAASAPS